MFFQKNYNLLEKDAGILESKIEYVDTLRQLFAMPVIGFGIVCD